MRKRGIDRNKIMLIIFVILLFVFSSFSLVAASELVPVQTINSQSPAKLSAEYYDSIYICDAFGKPKTSFVDTENVYLCDGRIYETLNEFFARTHNRGYNIETQEFMPKYVNMYQPNSFVDIYVVWDQKLYEDELPRFYIPRSTPLFSESRTVNDVIRRFTVKTDDEGRLPFVSLGKFDIHNLQPRRPYGSGRSRTFNYADEPGNILSSDPYENKGLFDVFVDANQDKHYSWTGDLYQSGIVGQSWLKEEPDYFINPITTGFVVKLATHRLRQNCCYCEDGAREIANVNDVYECDQFCIKQGKETIGWVEGRCELPEEEIIEEVEFAAELEEPVEEPAEEVIEEPAEEIVPPPAPILEQKGDPKEAFTKAFIMFLIIFAVIVCIAILLKEVYAKRY
jgi:hypothetical protein